MRKTACLARSANAFDPVSFNPQVAKTTTSSRDEHDDARLSGPACSRRTSAASRRASSSRHSRRTGS